MSDHSVVIHWGTAVPGREKVSLEVFASAVNFYGQLKNDGQLEGFQTVVFEQGNMSHCSGMMILSGSKSQVQTVLDSDKHQELLTKAMHVVSDVHVRSGVTGEAVQTKMQNVTKCREELGL